MKKDANTKQFQNEITETPVQDNNTIEQPIVQDNGVQNGATENTSQGDANIDGTEREVHRETPQNTPNEIENSAETKTKQVETKVKDGRGRKPLSDEEKLKRANEKLTGKKEVKDEQLTLDDELKKYQTTTDLKSTAPTAQPTGTNANSKADYVDMSKYVSGALFLIAIDIVMPTLTMTIAGFIDKRYNYVEKKLLKLTSEEKKELEPIAEQVVKILFGYVHPVVAFGIMLGIMYMGKIMMIDDSVLDKAEIKMNQKLALKNVKK